jgi:PAS domain S-box-containing protein
MRHQRSDPAPGVTDSPAGRKSSWIGFLKKVPIALEITAAYLIVGVLWILLSDKILFLLASDPVALTRMSIIKGWFFIGFTSLMIYALISRGEIWMRRSEKRFQDILNRAPSVIYVKDSQGHYAFVNSHFEKLSGFRREEILDRTDFELFPLHVARQSTDNDRKAYQMDFPLETEEIAPVGNEMHTFISAKFPLYDSRGEAYAICGVSTDITERKLAEMDRERLIGELQNALSKVRLLSGFLPICASCKKIRDDQGYWQQVEEYIRDHSEAEFSHSLCPECGKKLYPFLHE